MSIKLNLELKPDQKVFTDKKTKACTFALPFRLKDGTAAVCMVTRLKEGDWKPDEIKSVIINFK